MPFSLVTDADPSSDPIVLEQQLLERASEPAARLWQAVPSLVVPRSYRSFPAFDAACAQFAAQGWPVHVRPSGGGLVPLDRGVLNVSLAYPVAQQPGAAVEAIYHHLCQLLVTALQPLGVTAHWQAVAGSFCDGRFNLAVGRGERAQKIAGTAQYWRLQRTPGTGASCYRVLAHALLLVEPDLVALHQRANAFETLLGSGRSYAPEKTTSIARLCGSGIMATVIERLQQVIRQAEPPQFA